MPFGAIILCWPIITFLKMLHSADPDGILAFTENMDKEKMSLVELQTKKSTHIPLVKRPTERKPIKLQS